MGAAEHRRVAYFSPLLFQNLHATNHICCQNTLSFHHKKKKKEFIMSFSSAGRKSGIPSVLVWFLDLLQGRTFYFKVHVVFMLCLVGAPRPLLVVASVSSECKHLKT